MIQENIVGITQEDITRIAQECQLIGMQPHLDGIYQKALERFVILVVSADRERIKQINAPEIEKINAHIKMLENAIKTEREICAQIADEWVTNEQKQFGNGGPGAAIRARNID